jgi:Spy/CpxP family protein refolding chaperone
MKNFLFLLALAAAATCPAIAQTADSTSDPGYTAARTATARKPLSPTQRAARQLNTLQQKLNLNQDQVIQLRMILLNLNVSLDSLRTNTSGDKKADNKARQMITREADGKTYALLTTDQQLLYAQWKKEQREKAMEKRLNQKADSATPSPGTANPPQQP